jgi:hypothetical protein
MGWEHACMNYCSDGDKDEDGTLDAYAFAVFASCAMCRLAYTINTCVLAVQTGSQRRRKPTTI